MNTMSYRDILMECTAELKSAGMKEPESDAWILFEEAFSMDRTAYLMRASEAADPDGVLKYREFIGKRCEHIPVQYITGKAYFMGLEFHVTPDVLIPRFDTEVLTEHALKLINSKSHVLDICTGSGCIAVAVSVLGKPESVTASDISPAALRIASENAEQNGAGDIKFVESDLYDNIEGNFDIILSNPPYIASSVIESLDSEVKDHEPRLALDGSCDGLLFYRRLISGAGKHLVPDGFIMMETGYDQGKAVADMLYENKFADIKVIKDLAGLDRVVCGRRI